MAVPKKKISKSRSLIKLNNKVEVLQNKFVKVNYLNNIFPLFFYNKLKKMDILNKSFFYNKLTSNKKEDQINVIDGYKKLMSESKLIEGDKLVGTENIDTILNSYKNSKNLNAIIKHFLVKNVYFVGNKFSLNFFRESLVKFKGRMLK